ncbi:MAG: MFS transporter [Gemmatimonadales bacterium]|nr:MFS transporter [Gemmatimonadales bacterium]
MNKDFKTRQVVTISAAHLSHDIFSSFLAPLLPLLIAKLGLSLAMAAVLDVVRKGPALFNPFIGLLADRICMKYMVIVAPAITATTMCLLGVAPTFPILIILLVVGGVSAVVFHVPGPVLIKYYSGDKTGRGMSFFMFGGELARTLGPLLITAALSIWGLEGSIRVLPLGLVATILLYFRLRDLEPMDRKKQDSQDGAEKESVRSHIPLLAGIGGFLLFRMGIKSALTLYLPTYLVGQGETLWIGGGALALLQMAGALSTFASGYIADRFGHRRTLVAIAILTPPVALALTFSQGWLMVPLLALVGFLLFSSGPILLALVQDTDTNRPAFINSLFMTMNWLAGAVAVLFVGFLGDQVGLEAAFKVGAALSILAIPFLILIKSKFVHPKG